ncbi:hypothetical protein ACFV14_10960 [Streptomyces zaomyceticus]|uniref:hypothetical protein n=1 Tax=Streptomyces zaomyceticus TaxID=68286 RepID=UPI0036A46FAF
MTAAGQTRQTFLKRVIGQDGKTYPPRRMSKLDREFLRGRVHCLSHDENLSVRQVVARLADDHGVQRSVGWVFDVLRNYRCTACVQVVPSAAPEHLSEVDQ